jgi:hypothetical protein
MRSRGDSLPLHDHPQMYGFMRALRGSVQVSSYSWLDPGEERRLLHERERGGGKGIRENGGLMSRPARFQGYSFFLVLVSIKNIFKRVNFIDFEK